MKINRLFVISFVVLTLAISIVSAVQPFGVEQNNLIKVNSTRAIMDVAGNQTAIAGNVTELDITAFSTTQTWAGYFGNVSGTIQLVDNNDNVFYNWSLPNPEGEVYATELTNVNWGGITCFDLANEHSTLEAYFNIASDDVDGVNETFSDANSHDLFYSNNVEFTQGQCPATYIYDETGKGNSTKFQEVLMTDGTSNQTIIYTTLVEESAVVGFDNRDHDFQMLVLEDGHGTDVSTRDYYFYVELE